MTTNESPKERKKTSRWEKLDWFLTFGELLLYIPRLFGRLFRRVFDWF